MNAWESFQYTLINQASEALAARGVSGIRTLGARLGSLMWHGLPSRRRLAVNTMMERLGLDVHTATALARQSFAHNAQSFLEIALAPQFGFHREDLRVEQPELLDWLAQCDRPLVVTTAHLGAWELSAGLAGDFVARQAKPGMVVVRNHGNKAVREYMFAMRGGRGTQIIGHRNAVFPALKTLRKKGLVGFLADHNAGSDEAVFLPFLGKTAAVNVGPAVLAVRAEALVWPLVVVREGDGYVFLSGDILDTTTLPGGNEERVQATASFYTRTIEDWVRRYPEQWFWMHKRWKTRPPNEK